MPVRATRIPVTSTYSSILAKRLFKFAFGSAVAQARDVEIVTGVVVAVAAVSAVLFLFL